MAESRAGIGIDAKGNAVIDPTKNVEALVKALEETQDKLRACDTLRQDDLREAQDRRHKELSDQRDMYEARIEALRTTNEDRLAAVRTDFDKRIADILERQSDKSAILLSGTVDKLGATTNERISAVEKNQYVRGGETSVSDPQLAGTLKEMAATIQALSVSKDTAVGHSKGVGDSWAYLVGGAGLVVLIYEMIQKISH
jgi:hypothetical protein